MARPDIVEIKQSLNFNKIFGGDTEVCGMIRMGHTNAAPCLCNSVPNLGPVITHTDVHKLSTPRALATATWLIPIFKILHAKAY